MATSNRNALEDLNGNARYHAATFPRRRNKAYSWYLPEDTMLDRRVKTEKRRTQLLDQYLEEEEEEEEHKIANVLYRIALLQTQTASLKDETAGNVSIGEWIALVKERDQLLKESVKQENEEAKLKFISELQHLLMDVPDFSPQKDVSIIKSVSALKENIDSYCIVHKIPAEKTKMDKQSKYQTTSELQKSPPKPPVPAKKPKMPAVKVGSHSRSSKVIIPAKMNSQSDPIQINAQKESINSHSNGGHVKTTEEHISKSNGTTVNCVPSQTSEIDVPSGTIASVTVDSVPIVPPPPPPLPNTVACRLVLQEERKLLCGSLPNSNCSSLSFQDEITAHKKDNLRRVTGPKSPGGTPVRTLEHTDILQRALMKKFHSIHIHSTPKRGGLMESGSIEVSSTWSEWGASLDNHQYASDPDLTHYSRNLSSPMRQSSPCSAADFDSSFSSPSLTS